MCLKVKDKLQSTMHKLETFTHRQVRKRVAKERSRDKERTSGFLGWCLSPKHVHYYRKLLRRFLFLLGTVLFGTGVILLVLTYTPTTTYEGGKVSGPVLIVIGAVLGVSAALWMVYKKDVKKSRKEVYMAEKKEEERNNNNEPWPRLGNQDYNKNLSNFVAYSKSTGGHLEITEHYGDNELAKVTKVPNRRRRYQQKNPGASGIGTNDVDIDVPDIRVHRSEEDWKLALAIATAMEAEADLEQDASNNSKSHGSNNASYQNEDEDCSDSDIEPIHMNAMYSKTKHTLPVPNQSSYTGKKGGPGKSKNRHQQQVVVEHHNLDRRREDVEDDIDQENDSASEGDKDTPAIDNDKDKVLDDNQVKQVQVHSTHASPVQTKRKVLEPLKTAKIHKPAIIVNGDYIKIKGRKGKKVKSEMANQSITNVQSPANGISLGEQNKTYVHTDTTDDSEVKVPDLNNTPTTIFKAKQLNSSIESDIEDELEDIETFHIDQEDNNNKLSANFRSPSPNITIRSASPKPPESSLSPTYTSPKLNKRSLSPNITPNNHTSSRSASPYLQAHSNNFSRDNSFNSKSDNNSNGVINDSNNSMFKNGRAGKHNKSNNARNGLVLNINGDR